MQTFSFFLFGVYLNPYFVSCSENKRNECKVWGWEVWEDAEINGRETK
jgi:hypothetical protein